MDPLIDAFNSVSRLHKNQGYCHICRQFGDLTFEHYPPRACNNKGMTRAWTLEDETRESPRSRRFPRGIGGSSLCCRCNGWLGNKYVSAYLAFAEQGRRLIDRVPTEPVVYLSFAIRPLEVLKQIVAMSLAASTWGHARKLDSLRRFVLQPRFSHIPFDYHFYIYFNRSGESRAVGQPAARVDLDAGRHTFVLAEVAASPFGFVAAAEERGEPFAAARAKLCNITHFRDYAPGVSRTVWLKVPCRTPNSGMPLHYPEVT